MASLALLALATPAPAQEMTLPSGLTASLFDVVLEEAGEVMAPDAYTDSEALLEGEFTEDLPLDVDPATVGTVPGTDDPDDGAFEDEATADAEPADEAAEDAGVGAEPGAASGGLARFRLRVEGLGGEGATYEDVAGDFLWLCEQVALPALAANGWAGTEVVVSLSDREVDFGTPDPEAMQFFEGFRIADGTCVPQAF